MAETFTAADLNELAAEIERRRAAGTFTPPISAAPAPAPPPAAPAPKPPALKPEPATLRAYLQLPGREKAEVPVAVVKKLEEDFHAANRVKSYRAGVRGAAAEGDAGSSCQTLTEQIAARKRAAAREAALVAAAGPAPASGPSPTSAAFARFTTMHP